MPELPEVESIRKSLIEGSGNHPSLIGLKIDNAQVLWDRTIAFPTVSEFISSIIDQRITGIGRRGKYLQVHLDQYVLVVHLRMSGDLFIEPKSTPMGKHHRMVVDFQNGYRLSFNDTRKFGRVWLSESFEKLGFILGPEPLEDQFTGQLLYEKLKSRRRQIKPLLMDQKFLAGLGNIYTDECLFRSGIHPKTLANSLPFAKVIDLWRSIREVLMEGILNNGASIDWVYRGGNYQNNFYVYQRNGEDCRKCGYIIDRIVVSQRGTHFCPNCQPLISKPL